MGLTVAPETGRTACADSISAFLAAVDGFSEYELLGGSRCHGWSRLDVVAHVIAGWHEMLGGLVSLVEDAPTVDSASYWPAFAEEYATDDPIPALMAQRRRGAAYGRPSSAVRELGDIAAALLRGLRTHEGACLWQGQVFTAGDFLTIWAVENVVHQLDLLSAEPAPSSALSLARATVEALVGEVLPAAWTDADAVLIGAGRVPIPASAGRLADRLPALS